MKKILFILATLMMVTTTTKAQNSLVINNQNNSTLLVPVGLDIYYGEQEMSKKECAEFLSTRHTPAYETFQKGLKCATAGWWTLGAGLAVDLAGSILWAYSGPKESDAMFYSGASLIIAGGIALIASIPTIYVGYNRIYRGVDMFNASQMSKPQAYWTIQGSQNGIGIALNF